MNTILLWLILIGIIIFDISIVNSIKNVLKAINQNEAMLRDNLAWLRIHRETKMD